VTSRDEEASMIEWHEGEVGAPRDRRLLLIGSAEKGGTEIVIGHWNAAREEFVPVEPLSERGGVRTALKVKWWAEAPDLPLGIELRPLQEGWDFRG
jgi:hypothetical protein